MRVLQVIGTMNTGGMQTSIMNNFRVLSKHGVTFDFLIFDKESQFFEQEINDLGGRVYKLVSRRKNFIKNRIELRKFFKMKYSEYDAVEFHQGITYYYPLKMAYKYKWKNKIIRNHGVDRNILKRMSIINDLYIKKIICKYGDRYTSCNMDLNNHLFTDKIIKSKKIQFLPNGINVKCYLFSEQSRDNIREICGFTKEDIVVGHVGLFNEVKNHKFLLKMFEELHKKNNKYKLLLIGDGELKDNICNFIKEHDLESHVFIAGNIYNVEEYLSAMDIFAFPSIFEGLPMALIEAQASGLPVLASKNIQNSISITDKCTFLDIDSIENWINHILYEVELNNKYERLQIGDIVDDSLYSIKNIARLLKKVYEGDK